MTQTDADTPENADIVAAVNDLQASLEEMSESFDEFSAVLTAIEGDTADSTAVVGDASRSPEHRPDRSGTETVADD